VGTDGQVLHSCASGVTPESAEHKSAIDAARAK
jgi:hypothetical protein